jgi:hypothetical protein
MKLQAPEAASNKRQATGSISDKRQATGTLHQPQPPAKYIRFSEICQQLFCHNTLNIFLDFYVQMGYSRTITDGNARLAQLNASPSIPLGSKPVSPSQVPCNNLKKVWGKAVASPGVGILKPEPSSGSQDISHKQQAPRRKQLAT